MGVGGGNSHNNNNNNFANMNMPIQLNDADDPLLRALGGLTDSNLPSPERGGGMNRAFDQIYLSNSTAAPSSSLNYANPASGSSNRVGGGNVSYAQSVPYGNNTAGGGMNNTWSGATGLGGLNSSSGADSILNNMNINHNNQILSQQSPPSSSLLLASPMKAVNSNNNTSFISRSNSTAGGASSTMGGLGSIGVGGGAPRPLSLGGDNGYASLNSTGGNGPSLGNNNTLFSSTSSSGLTSLSGGGASSFKQPSPSVGVSTINNSSLSLDATQQSQGGGGGMYPQGIDADIVTENLFPSVAWLRNYDMHMYRWSGDAKDWTEFAMHVPGHIIAHLLGPEGSNINEFKRLSGCNVWSDKEFLHGQEALFLVFNRGPSGSPSNAHMNTALEIISSYMSQPASLQALNNENFKMHLHQQQQQHKQAGTPSS
jgi:hypothetical protein